MGSTATVVSRSVTKRPPYPSGVPAGTRRTAVTRASSVIAGTSAAASADSRGATP